MSDGMASSACLRDCLIEIADLQDYTFYQTTVTVVPHGEGLSATVYYWLLWTGRHDKLEKTMQFNCRSLEPRAAAWILVRKT